MRWVKLATAALLVGFLVGFGPMYMKQQELEKSTEATRIRLEAEVKDLSSRLKISQLHSQLGMLLLEVGEKNFGTAKQRSSEFFNQLNTVAAEQTGEEVGRQLDAIKNSRDEITAGLATAEGETESKLRKLYVDLAVSAGVK